MMKKDVVIWGVALLSAMYLAIFMPHAVRSDNTAPEKGVTVKDPKQRNDLALIQGEVTNTKAIGGKFLNTVKIVRVYCGPGELLGRLFQDSSSEIGPDSIGAYIIPPLKNGEVAIWALKVSDAGELISIRYPAFGFKTPARQKLTPRYKQIEQLSEAVHQVCIAAAVDQQALLLKYALSGVPEIAYWAIHRYANTSPAPLDKEIRAIVENGPTIRGQIAADEVLSEHSPESWTHSAERIEILKRWVAGPHDQYDTDYILRRIDVSFQYGEIDRILLNELSELSDDKRMSEGLKRILATRQERKK